MDELKQRIHAILEAIRAISDVVEVKEEVSSIEDMYEVKAWIRFQGSTEDVVVYLM